MNAVNRPNSLKEGVLIPVEARIVFFATTSGPELGPTKSPIQWIPGRLPTEVKQTDRAIKNQTHISPRLRTQESNTHLTKVTNTRSYTDAPLTSSPYCSTTTTLTCTWYRNFKYVLVHWIIYHYLITQLKAKFIMLPLFLIIRNQEYNCINSE